MTIKYHLALSIVVLSAALLVSGRGYAQLSGSDRDVFVKASFQSCSEALQKTRKDLPNNAITTYCMCMANGEADMTTKADIEYINAHHEANADYSQRVKAIAPRCNAAAGLH